MIKTIYRVILKFICLSIFWGASPYLLLWSFLPKENINFSSLVTLWGFGVAWLLATSLYVFSGIDKLSDETLTNEKKFELSLVKQKIRQTKTIELSGLVLIFLSSLLVFYYWVSLNNVNFLSLVCLVIYWSIRFFRDCSTMNEYTQKHYERVSFEQRKARKMRDLQSY